MFTGSDLIKLALKEARFFLVTEVLNMSGIQQKGDSPLLALTMKGTLVRNCGWSQGAGSSMLAASNELETSVLQP